MNEDKRNRRRFLADMLFAGAALTGATFLAKSALGQTIEPQASATPVPSPEPPHPAGAPLPPQPPPPPVPGPPVAPRRVPATDPFRNPNPGLSVPSQSQHTNVRGGAIAPLQAPVLESGKRARSISPRNSTE